jgi:hypothetical protein
MRLISIPTVNARMWVYVGDAAHPYNIFDFTLSRGRDGPKYFLKNYNQVLLADGYGGYNISVRATHDDNYGCFAAHAAGVMSAMR